MLASRLWQNTTTTAAAVAIHHGSESEETTNAKRLIVACGSPSIDSRRASCFWGVLLVSSVCYCAALDYSTCYCCYLCFYTSFRIVDSLCPTKRACQARGSSKISVYSSARRCVHLFVSTLAFWKRKYDHCPTGVPRRCLC
jgi:hypothetical protein